MEELFQIAQLALFAGIEDIAAALSRLHSVVGVYPRGGCILRTGERCTAVGILLEGGADIVREDAGGDPVTVAHIGAGELFAEAFACAGIPLSVTVTATSEARVLWLSAERLLSGEGARLSANALRLFARKNVFLTERIHHLSRHSLEEKVLSYLRAARRAAGKSTFSIPFDRQGLADYLGCDRSALSAVLSRLRRRGVLDFHKSTFRLP